MQASICGFIAFPNRKCILNNWSLWNKFPGLPFYLKDGKMLKYEDSHTCLAEILNENYFLPTLE